MDYDKIYSEWKSFVKNAEVAAELISIENDEAEKRNRFSSELHFGTAGLRGKLGAGTNRMNVYTVGLATQGFARYVINNGGQAAGVAVSYDTRKNSSLFARTAAKCLAANGIKTYLFSEPASVPELSFTIKRLGTFGGIVITASHNPKDYNGYKAYAPWGGQLLDDASNEVTDCIEKIKSFDEVKSIDFDEAVGKGLIKLVGADIDSEYWSRLLKLPLKPDNIKNYGEEITLAYTPLFGTGIRTFKGIIKGLPYNYQLVSEQCDPDPEFPGMNSPNPEDSTAMEKVISLAKERKADIAIGTDPDADRMGAAIPNENGEYIMLSGNQVGCIITEYMLRNLKETGKLNPTDFIVKSFVTTRMVEDIAAGFGIECITVPTGFKYIADAINTRKERKFVFGFEESCGFLTGDFVSDKDGVMAMTLLLEVLCECKSRGESLYTRLKKLYEEYGWHKEKVISLTMEGEDGMAKISAIMEKFRISPPENIGGQKKINFTDYQTGKYTDDKKETVIDFPRENALIFGLEKGWVCVRPSGTEPKIKIYAAVTGADNDESDKLLSKMEEDLKRLTS